MSHSWRKPWQIGLFHDVVWCDTQAGAVLAERHLDAQASPTPEGLLDELRLLLGLIDKKKLKPRKVDVLVSDELAAFLTLPWQDALQNQNEIDSYAQIKFEKNGLVINEEWVMHTEFRDFKAMGNTYALSKSWLQALCRLLAEHQLTLRRVLPLSAAVIARQPKPKKNHFNMVLLEERNRLCAVLHADSGLVAYEVEPVIGDLVQSRARLLRRVHARFNAIPHIHSWQSRARSAPQQLGDAELALFWTADQVGQVDHKASPSMRGWRLFNQFAQRKSSTKQCQYLTRGHWFPL